MSENQGDGSGSRQGKPADLTQTESQGLPEGQDTLPAGRGKAPGLIDALLVFAAFMLLWLIISLVVSFLSPYLSKVTLTYLGGFLIQGSIALTLTGLILGRGFGLSVLGYRRVPFGSLLLSAFAAYASVLVADIIYGLFIVLKGLKPPVQNVYDYLFTRQDPLSVALTLLLAVIIAPVLEETFFRGVIYNSLRSKLAPWLSALISAAVFSGIHMQLWGFVPRFFLGIALALLYEKYRSLYPGMALHALNNTIAVLIGLTVKLPS